MQLEQVRQYILRAGIEAATFSLYADDCYQSTRFDGWKYQRNLSSDIAFKLRELADSLIGDISQKNV